MSANPNKWDAAMDARLMDAVANGLTLAEVAERMGMSLRAIQGRFSRLREAMGPQAV